jgi:hypothetical protein
VYYYGEAMTLLRTVLLCPLFLLPIAAMADECNPVQPRQHPIALLSGDRSTATSFEAARPFTGQTLRLEGCYGDLQVVRSREASTVRLLISADRNASGQNLSSYVHTLRTTGDGRIAVRLPRNLSGTVKLEVPAEVHLQVKWASGKVNVESAVEGDKEIDLGKGKMRVYVNDNDYAEIEANVGWGTIEDHLPNVERHRMLRSVAISQVSKGKHNLELNLGKGNIEILKAD